VKSFNFRAFLSDIKVFGGGKPVFIIFIYINKSQKLASLVFDIALHCVVINYFIDNNSSGGVDTMDIISKSLFSNYADDINDVIIKYVMSHKNYSSHFAEKEYIDSFSFLHGLNVSKKDISEKNIKFICESYDINFYMPVHMHRWFEMEYIAAGSCVNYTNGKEIPMNQGDICIMSRKAVHSFGCRQKNALVINTILLDSIFEGITGIYMLEDNPITNFISGRAHTEDYFMYFPTAYSHKVQSVAQMFFNECQKHRFASSATAEALFIILLNELNQFGLYSYYGVDPTIKPILDYICKNYKTATLNSVAEKFSYTPNYLGKLILKHTGKTYSELIKEIKLNAAEKLLSNNDLSIEDIIYEVGYSSNSYFFKLFREKHGITPTEYRKKLIIR